MLEPAANSWLAAARVGIVGGAGEGPQLRFFRFCNKQPATDAQQASTGDDVSTRSRRPRHIRSWPASSDAAAATLAQRQTNQTRPDTAHPCCLRASPSPGGAHPHTPRCGAGQSSTQSGTHHHSDHSDHSEPAATAHSPALAGPRSSRWSDSVSFKVQDPSRAWPLRPDQATQPARCPPAHKAPTSKHAAQNAKLRLDAHLLDLHLLLLLFFSPGHSRRRQRRPPHHHPQGPQALLLPQVLPVPPRQLLWQRPQCLRDRCRRAACPARLRPRRRRQDHAPSRHPRV
ncbi:hypothetical protein G7Z17_g13042 [Cylindrodendrum hubeiense]|uniref:Uncharacterized protein n=1 Tax=Cylindrodendrum hubeiense TaxID=595255 RepID=A0A9P5L8M9_9HYPO|nr:hypothetical protein G7Z17_g13042 [Cylindrodendrum hubeiense]